MVAPFPSGSLTRTAYRCAVVALGFVLPRLAEAQALLDIGQGRYAFYAHLRPGSLRVRVGDRVRKGQVLGLVGNSGNSTEPHLHFHLMDGTSPLGSEGIPYAHERFDLVGTCRRMFAECARSTADPRRGEIPLANMVIAFP